MNRKLKWKWLTALRSGKYSQTKNLMRDDTGHDPFSVVMAVAFPGVIWTRKRTPKPCFEASYKDVKRRFNCPPTVRKELGLTVEQRETIESMNDSGKSFKEIADYIENNV